MIRIVQAKTDPPSTITKNSVAKRTAEFKSLRNIKLCCPFVKGIWVWWQARNQES
jgi:hypothetical protein